jgi:hypothetical protein
MKMRILAVLAALAMASASIAATDNANDVAYDSGINGQNGGSGFNAWSVSGGGSFGSFIGSSVGQGFGDIDVSGEAFGFWANPAGANFVNADRTFSSVLAIGETFSIDLAIAFRNGNKGIDLDVGAGTGVWNFNVGGDVYSAGLTGFGVDLGWAYSQTSIFQLDVTQISATEISVVMTRGGDVYNSGNLAVGGQLTGFGLYNSGTDAGDDRNNLFANNLQVVPEPSTMVMALMGALGLVAARRRLQK